MNEIQLATFEIDFETWQEFKNKASRNHRTASSLLREFVDAYLHGDPIPLVLSKVASESPGVDENLVKLIEALIQDAYSDRMNALEARYEQLESTQTKLGSMFLSILNGSPKRSKSSKSAR